MLVDHTTHGPCDRATRFERPADSDPPTDLFDPDARRVILEHDRQLERASFRGEQRDADVRHAGVQVHRDVAESPQRSRRR